MKEKKAGIEELEVKSFWGRRELPLTDIPSISRVFAYYGYKGLASACIDVIANSVASNEWYLLKPKKNNKKTAEEIVMKSRQPLPDELVDENDDVYKLLIKPNPIFQ